MAVFRNLKSALFYVLNLSKFWRCTHFWRFVLLYFLLFFQRFGHCLIVFSSLLKFSFVRLRRVVCCPVASFDSLCLTTFPCFICGFVSLLRASGTWNSLIHSLMFVSPATHAVALRVCRCNTAEVSLCFVFFLQTQLSLSILV